MIAFLLWYLIVSLIGWLTFPLAHRMFPALWDRGYGFSRTLGLLLWGFFFWLLASLGILNNDSGGLLFALLLLVGLSAWMLWRGGREELSSWLAQNRGTVLVFELLFLLAFSGMAVVRSANPEALGTEKPMELAFINAILNSPTFPPHDPWLSGYAISYYYFGYVLVAMLAKLAVTNGSIAFNLGIALVFALSAVGAYSLVYNLLAAWQRRKENVSRVSRSLPLLGPLFLLLVSNLEGFLHVLHTRGLFWRAGADGSLSSGFWKWIDIQDLVLPPEQPFSWVPTKFWWWWRASRVVSDYKANGQYELVIDEFPAFSYLLGDLHPHVLAMPFALLAVALAMNLALGGARGRMDWLQHRVSNRLLAWLSLFLIAFGLAVLWLGVGNLNLRAGFLGFVSLLAGGFALVGVWQHIGERGLGIFRDGDSGERLVGLPIYIAPIYFIFSALILGGLAFLNTWDFPLYVGLFSAAYILNRHDDQENQDLPAGSLVVEFLAVAVLLGISGALLYLPFYLSFSSQAGGILPSMAFFTRGAHFWVMFAPLLIPILAYIGFLWSRAGDRRNLRKAALLVIAGSLSLFVLSLLLGFVIIQIPAASGLFLGVMGAGGAGELIRASIVRRLSAPGTWLTLLALLSFTVALLWPRRAEPQRDTRQSSGVANGFVLLLVLFGALLILGSEFFYLRDFFGTRMNTIFKFYYQTWIMWSVAAAFGSAILLKELRGAAGVAFSLVLVVVIGVGLVYPVLGFWNKTEGFSPSAGWTLDGVAYLERQTPDDMAAIRWLAQAPDGVLAEAVGGSYSAYARAATISGKPNVLGWPGHESQWRGGSQEMGSRENDMRRLYCTRDWDEAQTIIDQYDIRYIFLGSLERSTYSPEVCGTNQGEAKFQRILIPAFQQGDTVVYEVP